MPEVFDIHGRVSADTSPFEQSMDTTANAVRGSLNAIHAAAITHIANGVVRSFIKASQAANAFGQSLANISAISDANLNILRKQIMGLSDVYGTAKDVTESIYETISSGIRGTEQDYINFVKSAKHTAVSIRADLYDTVNVLTTLLNSYGGSIRDVGKFSDMLFVTVREGKAHGKDLTKTLGLVANTAAEAGVRVEEMMAVIATLSRTQTASQSMIGFNQLLNAIIKPSIEAQTAARKYGIELGLTALRAKGLTNVLEEIKTKTAGDLQALNAIMGPIRAMRAGVALTGTQFDEFVGLVKTGAQEIRNGESAFAAFEKQTNTTAQAVENLKVRFDKLQITMGEDLAPIFNVLIGGADGLMKSFMNREPWERWIVYISAGSAVGIKLISVFTTLRATLIDLHTYLSRANKSSTDLATKSSDVGGGFATASKDAATLVGALDGANSKMSAVATSASALSKQLSTASTASLRLGTRLGAVKKSLTDLISPITKFSDNITKTNAKFLTLSNRTRRMADAITRASTRSTQLSGNVLKANSNALTLRDRMTSVANATAKATKNIISFNKGLVTAVRNAEKLQNSLNLNGDAMSNRHRRASNNGNSGGTVRDKQHATTYALQPNIITPEVLPPVKRVPPRGLPSYTIIDISDVRPPALSQLTSPQYLHSATAYNALKSVIDSRRQNPRATSMTPELASRMRNVVMNDPRQTMPLTAIVGRYNSMDLKKLTTSGNNLCKAMDNATAGLKDVPNVAKTINEGALGFASKLSAAGAWLSTAFMKINIAVLIAEAVASIVDAQVTAYQERKQSEQQEAHDYRERNAMYRRGVSRLNLLRDAGKLDEKGYASGLAEIAKFKTQDELDAYIAELRKDAPITADDIETSRKNRIETMQKEQADVKAANALYEFTRTNSRVNLGAAGMDMLVDEFMQTPEGKNLKTLYSSKADHGQALSEDEIRTLLTNMLKNNDHYRTIALKQAAKARGKYITYEYKAGGGVYGSLNASGTQLLSDIAAGKVKHEGKVVSVEEFANNPSLRATLLDSYFGDEVTQGLKIESLTADDKDKAIKQGYAYYYADMYNNSRKSATPYSDLDFVSSVYRAQATGESMTAVVDSAVEDLHKVITDTEKAIKDSEEVFTKYYEEAKQQDVDTSRIEAAHKEHLRSLGIRVDELKEQERRLLESASDAIKTEYKSLMDGDIVYGSGEFMELKRKLDTDIVTYSRSQKTGVQGRADKERLETLYALRGELDKLRDSAIKHRTTIGALKESSATAGLYNISSNRQSSMWRNIIATPVVGADIATGRNVAMSRQAHITQEALYNVIQAKISDADDRVSKGTSMPLAYTTIMSDIASMYKATELTRNSLQREITNKQAELRDTIKRKLDEDRDADTSAEENQLNALSKAMNDLTAEYGKNLSILRRARRDIQSKIATEREKIGTDGVKSMMPILKDYSSQRDHRNRLSNDAIYHSVNLLARIAGVRPTIASRGTAFEVANTPLNVKNAQQAQTLISRTLDAYMMSQKYAEANKGQAVVNIYNLLKSNIGKGIIVG